MFIKLVLGNQIHILNKEITMTEIHSFIADRFKNIPESYNLTYIDSDGDTISIMSDNDIKSLQQLSNGKATKVFISKVESSSETESIQEIKAIGNLSVDIGVEQIKNDNILPEIVRDPVSQIIVEQSIVSEANEQLIQQNQAKEQQIKTEDKTQNSDNNTHVGVRCDGCNTFPIVGIRYKCIECFDFDYCQKCEDTTKHEHDFIKIRKPKQHGLNNPFKIFQKHFVKPMNSNQQQKFQKKYKKIQNLIKKPIQAFAHILKAHPISKSCVFKKMNAASVLKRKQPQNNSIIIEPTQVEQIPIIQVPVVKLFTNPIIVKTQAQQSKTQQKTVIEKSEQQLILESVEEIIGSTPKLKQFVAKNYKQGVQQLIQKWFDQK